MASGDNSSLTRHNFPKDFLFGAATSAYQVEGGYKQDGRSFSNWDAFVLQRPGKIIDGSNGCIATDHYNQFKEDVALMKKLGLDTYRLSISWSRILPGGKLCNGVNREGVKFYNDLINLLLSQGIEPFVTMFHFDVPQCLEEEYGGFLNHKIVQDFGDYANICFFEFGDRVKYWITENEPWTFTVGGYVQGVFPPGRGSPPPTDRPVVPTPPRLLPGKDKSFSDGNAGTEPYIVAHNLILAHATAVDIYRKNYQAVQGGKIGVTNMTTWYVPYRVNALDSAAASRAVDFMWGWFVGPIVKGDYPAVMRERVGDRLPKFSDDDTKLVKGSYDFIGMNYYTTYWAANNPSPPPTPPTYYTDQAVDFFTKRDGKQIGPQAGSDWLFIVPHGIYDLLLHTQQQYDDPIIYITENGVDEINDVSLTVTEGLKDEYRIQFHQDHLAYVKKAIDEKGVKVKGYMLWALLDNYEWTAGYTVRFGICYVDYANNLIRYPKDSAIWYMNFLNKNLLKLEENMELALAHEEEKKKIN